MKLKINSLFNPRIFIIGVFFITVTGMLASLPAYSQVDYLYGKNHKGLRIGAGGGVTQLRTHYNDNPLIGVFVATLDYDFNPYFSAGFEGQIGTLQGIDTHNPGHLYYASSTNSYKAATFNLKFGVGLIDDFYTKNGFMDAIKRIYLGVGAGVIKNDIAFTYNPSLAAYAYGTTKPYGYLPIIPFNFGTFIDIPNLLGYDRIEVNPNFQFTYIPSMYSDGFISSQYSHLKGFYNMTSIVVKYKFK